MTKETLKTNVKSIFVKVKNFFKVFYRYPDAGLLRIGGVCAGIAYQLKVEVLYVRLAFLMLLFFTNSLVFFVVWGIYFILMVTALIEEETPADYKKVCERKARSSIYRIQSAGLCGGVCAGLAYKLKIKTLFVRLSLILILILSVSLLDSILPLMAYLICWIAWPSRGTPKDYRKVSSFWTTYF